jgi:hypothetical protein
MLDTASGSDLGSYSSSFIPAFKGTTMFTTSGGVTSAQPIAGGSLTWSFGSAAETAVIAPIVVGEHVVVGTSMRVVVLASADGREVSSAPLANIRALDEQNVVELVGLAAADGMLFVPAGTSIVAY